MQLSSLTRKVNEVQQPCLRAVVQVPGNKCLEYAHTLNLKTTAAEQLFLQNVTKHQPVIAFSMDVSPRQSQFEVLEFGVECFTSRNSKDVALLEDLIEVYSAKTSPSEAKVDLQDFVSVDHVVWPACKAPLSPIAQFRTLNFLSWQKGKPEKYTAAWRLSNHLQPNGEKPPAQQGIKIKPVISQNRV